MHIHLSLHALPSHLPLVLKHDGVCFFTRISVVQKYTAGIHTEMPLSVQYISVHISKTQEGMQMSVLFPLIRVFELLSF